KEGISTCIKHLLELIKNAIRVNDNPDRFNINNSSVTYINIGSNDTDYITIGIDNQEPIKLLASYKDKELARTIINDNIVEKTHDDINNAEFTDGGIDDRSDIGIDSNDTDDIDIDNQEPIKSPANDENKKVGQTIINENIVENTHDINNKKMIFSAIKEIYDEDPSFIFDKISHKLRHTVTEFDESGKSEPTDLFTWYGKDKKGDSLAIVIKNKNGNDYLSLGYYDQDGYHIQKGFRIDGDNLTQYCSKKARSASAWFEHSKAIIAESFATGSDHQVVNELKGERLRELNEAFNPSNLARGYEY
ncbi:hypothetical protein J9483_004845, partial [Escherichia coli]|nr:hypothetical protein [Escherichia coli]